MHNSFFYVAYALILFSTSQLHANSNQQLQQIQNSIAAQEQNVQEQLKHRAQLQTQLAQQEKNIASASQELHKTRTLVNTLSQEIKNLTSSITVLQKKQVEQRTYLSQQLDSAFRLGRHSGLQMVIENKKTQRNERIMMYYNYINQTREENILALQENQQKLTNQQEQLQQKQLQQRNILSQRQTEQTKLEQAKKNRQTTLVALNSSLQKDQQKLTELRQNETRLRAKIAQATREAKSKAASEAKQAEQVRQKQQKYQYKPTQAEKDLMARTGGLGRPTSQFNRPVAGKVLNRFGELLQGEIRWKGMVIAAPEGNEVKAIADGRVLLADWLQGYGLVVVLEHGKDDMSLYGYNQSTLVKVGQNVKAGQSIGLVGISGGQKQSSLYFEIRRQGQAANPEFWLKK